MISFPRASFRPTNRIDYLPRGRSLPRSTVQIRMLGAESFFLATKNPGKDLWVEFLRIFHPPAKHSDFQRQSLTTLWPALSSPLLATHIVPVFFWLGCWFVLLCTFSATWKGCPPCRLCVFHPPRHFLLIPNMYLHTPNPFSVYFLDFLFFTICPYALFVA